MSHQEKLEKILNHLINEDVEKADELLHDLVVEKSRTIYESLVNEEEDDKEEEQVEEEVDADADDEEIEEAFGGDEGDDFVADVQADSDDIDADEVNDGEADDVEAGDDADSDFDAEADADPELADISAQLDDLKAMFAQLMGDVADVDAEVDTMVGVDPAAPAMAPGMAPAVDPELEGMYEATKLSDAVPEVPNKEAQLSGTGKDSKISATDTKSMFTKAPAKRIQGADPVKIGKGAADMSGSAESVSKVSASDNIGLSASGVSAGDQKAEGKPVGTGKDTKTGTTFSQSPLTKEPK